MFSVHGLLAVGAKYKAGQQVQFPLPGRRPRVFLQQPLNGPKRLPVDDRLVRVFDDIPIFLRQAHTFVHLVRPDPLLPLDHVPQVHLIAQDFIDRPLGPEGTVVFVMRVLILEALPPFVFRGARIAEPLSLLVIPSLLRPLQYHLKISRTTSAASGSTTRWFLSSGSFP